MTSENRLARVSAELIRHWHERYAREHRPPDMGEDSFREYLSRLAYFRASDLSDPRLQREIAEEQRSRVFEWFYGTPVPMSLWQSISREFDLEHSAPENLGQAANWILRALEPHEAPADPRNEPRHTVLASSREELLAKARQFYVEATAAEGLGIGGTNVLLSSSLERSSWHVGSEGPVILLQPEVLGLRVLTEGERPDDLIDAIRSREIIVESATGSPDQARVAPENDWRRA